MLRLMRFHELALQRLICLATSNSSHSSKLQELHQSLGHPGYARLSLYSSTESTVFERRNERYLSELQNVRGGKAAILPARFPNVDKSDSSVGSSER